MIKILNTILVRFRSVFTRRSSFEWFVVVIIGLMIKGDGIGVTSIVRELNLNPKYYESILHFFRSSAWKMENIIETWISVVKENAPILTVNGLNILIGDGVKQSKEGKRMPGVKKLHQESENSGKPEYIFGHLFGVVSVLIGNVNKQFSLPLSASIQDGVNAIHQYADQFAVTPSHVVQVIMQSGIISKILGKSVVLLDRYFLSVPAIKKTIEYMDKNGEQLLQLVTKAKISYTAYTEPAVYCGKGRPRKKGDAVKLKDLFITAIDKFITADLYLYGKMQTVQYFSIDLLWGVKLYKKLRFVLVKTDSFPPSIFVSTSLTLSPLQIIELYSYRCKIEISFKTLKHTVFGFCYHFWSKYMPKLNRYDKEQNIQALESITSKHIQGKIVATLRATEAFVMFSCIACGILQMLSIEFSGSVGLVGSIEFLKTRWLRSSTNVVVSEATVSYFLRKNFFRIFNKYSHFDIVRIIISKQDTFFDNFNESA